MSDVTITSASQNDILVHNGTNFVNTKTLGSLTQVGINATADSTNKLSVSSDAVLFNKATNDSRVKVNKNSSSDTASHLFQSNFSGHAEFGLIGNNNFTLKVSPEGSTWKDAIIVDNSTGGVNCKNDVDVDGNLNVGATNEAGIMEVKNSSGITTAKMNADGESFINGGSLIIGGTSVDATSILELSSTTQGFLPPRMTGTQRDAISSPETGLVIYNTTTNKLQCHNGTSWNDCF